MRQNKINSEGRTTQKQKGKAREKYLYMKKHHRDKIFSSEGGKKAHRKHQIQQYRMLMLKKQ